MRFEIAKIVRAVELREYAEEYGEREILVWVNPPVRLLNEHDRIVREAGEAVQAALLEPGGAGLGERMERAGAELAAVFAELWSQGPEETRWDVDEVKRLATEALEADPQLWLWLRGRTLEMIRAHREQIKKG